MAEVNEMEDLRKKFKEELQVKKPEPEIRLNSIDSENFLESYKKTHKKNMEELIRFMKDADYKYQP